MLHDLRNAFRQLAKHRGFATVVVATLALGIGANTAIFSVVNGVLLRPLPYERPDQLTFLWHRAIHTGAEKMRISAPDVVQFREQSRLFQDFAFTNGVADVSLADGREVEHARVGLVTHNFFGVLGVRPLHGRDFLPGEAIVSSARQDDSTAQIPPSVVILGHREWIARFGGDLAVLGRDIELNGARSTVIGVLPADFELHLPPDAGIPTNIDAWTPIRRELAEFRRTDGRLEDQDSDNTGAVIARLGPGVPLEQAQAEMNLIALQQRAAYAGYEQAGIHIDVVPMHVDVVAHVRPVLFTLLGAVGFVLLIACINVASLLLARAGTRRREMALRSALGAGHGRLMRQILTESALLAAMGGILGLLAALWGTELLLRLRPGTVTYVDAVGLDWRVLTFTGAATMLAALLSGIVPALDASHLGSIHALRGHGASAEASGHLRLRRILVVSEVALSIVLLAGAGLMLRSFVRLQDVRPGFEPHGVLTFRVSMAGIPGYDGPAARAQFLRRMTEQLREVPGVEAAGAVGALPLSGETWTQPYGVEGQPATDWPRNQANFRMITSGYFSAIGTRLLSGRFFTAEEDVVEAHRVVIVDEKLAQRLAPDGRAVGITLGFPLDGAPVWAKVVGVVEHVRHETLSRDSRETIYVPYRQEASRDVAIVVRGSAVPETMTDPVSRAIASLDPRLPVFGFRPMDRYVVDALAPTQFVLVLIGVFAGIAVMLAAVGLYGVLSHWVSQRTAEIGVRMALGANQIDILRRVVGSGMTLAGLGTVAGLGLSFVASRVLSGLLFGVTPTDVVTHLGIVLVLATVALIACVIPARRAARVDPVVALRAE
jgi:predicted permease